MRIAKTIQELVAYRAHMLARNTYPSSVGFVPTMGYLHQGHVSLVEAARKTNNVVVASIFVNPTQFAPTDDLNAYPRDLERDCKLLEKYVDILFAPSPQEMYPPEASTWVDVEKVVNAESESRPGHFRGVATVLTKLFNIVQPEHAYFGQKDAMQCIVVQKMVRDLNFQTKVVVCPTLREENGLAMSTRNQYLSPTERQKAGIIYKSLETAERQFKSLSTVDELKKIVGDIIQSEPIMNLHVASTLNGAELEGDLAPHKEVLLSVAAFCKGSQRNTRLIDNIILRR